MSSKQRSRSGQAAILTGVVVAMIVVLGVSLGATAVLLASVTLPVPLFLLWMSADVLRGDELRDGAGAETDRAAAEDVIVARRPRTVP